MIGRKFYVRSEAVKFQPLRRCGSKIVYSSDGRYVLTCLAMCPKPILFRRCGWESGFASDVKVVRFSIYFSRLSVACLKPLPFRRCGGKSVSTPETENRSTSDLKPFLPAFRLFTTYASPGVAAGKTLWPPILFLSDFRL